MRRARFMFSEGGMIRANKPAWRAYFKPDFHPSQQHSTLSKDWLQRNASAFSVVRQPA